MLTLELLNVSGVAVMVVLVLLVIVLGPSLLLLLLLLLTATTNAPPHSFLNSRGHKTIRAIPHKPLGSLFP